MTEPAPSIDHANLPAPTEGFRVTMFRTVRKVARCRDFYSRVLIEVGQSTGLRHGHLAAPRPADLPG